MFSLYDVKPHAHPHTPDRTQPIPSMTTPVQFSIQFDCLHAQQSGLAVVFSSSEKLLFILRFSETFLDNL